MSSIQLGVHHVFCYHLSDLCQGFVGQILCFSCRSTLIATRLLHFPVVIFYVFFPHPSRRSVSCDLVDINSQFPCNCTCMWSCKGFSRESDFVGRYRLTFETCRQKRIAVSQFQCSHHASCFFFGFVGCFRCSFQFNFYKWFPNVDNIAHFAEELYNYSALWRWNICHHLICFHFHQCIAGFNGLAFLYIPFNHSTFIKSFANVGEIKYIFHCCVCLKFDSFFEFIKNTIRRNHIKSFTFGIRYYGVEAHDSFGRCFEV